MKLYSADENRKAITLTKTRVNCDETKLDIFSSTNIPIKEYSPNTNLTPYNDIKRLYIDIETLGLNPLQDRIISIGVTLHTLTLVKCRLQAEIILLELPSWYSFFPTTAFYSEVHVQPH